MTGQTVALPAKNQVTCQSLILALYLLTFSTALVPYAMKSTLSPHPLQPIWPWRATLAGRARLLRCAPAWAGVLALAAFLRTLAPAVFTLDSPELTAAAHTQASRRRSSNPIPSPRRPSRCAAHPPACSAN